MILSRINTDFPDRDYLKGFCPGFPYMVLISNLIFSRFKIVYLLNINFNILILIKTIMKQ
jgi:hypothetical protein